MFEKITDIFTNYRWFPATQDHKTLEQLTIQIRYQQLKMYEFSWDDNLTYFGLKSEMCFKVVRKNDCNKVYYQKIGRGLVESSNMIGRENSSNALYHSS